MPLYNFECEACSHNYEEFRTIVEMDIPLQEPCSNCKEKWKIIRLIGSPRSVDPVRLESTYGRLKPTKEFTEVMSRIKRKHPESNFEIR